MPILAGSREVREVDAGRPKLSPEPAMQECPVSLLLRLAGVGGGLASSGGFKNTEPEA